MAEKFTKGGQEGWFHDPGYWGGFFHTYNELQLPHSKARQVHIFIPRDYEVSQEAYPVLYMNDGDTAFFEGGAYHKSWQMAQLLTRLYLSNQIRKIMVVAVCPLNRDYEYTHGPVLNKDWGGLDDYARYLAHDLKPFIDHHYRTLSQGEYNVILGASHGGLAAFYTATKYPDQFRNLAALSPSFWVGLDSVMDAPLLNIANSFFGSLNGSALIFNARNTLLNPQQRLKIYLDWGLIRTGGEHNSFMEERATTRGREMRDLLIHQFGYKQGQDLFIVEDPTGEHREESWASRCENILKLFFGFSRF
jgi:hypothetical protein